MFVCFKPLWVGIERLPSRIVISLVEETPPQFPVTCEAIEDCQDGGEHEISISTSESMVSCNKSVVTSFVSFFAFSWRIFFLRVYRAWITCERKSKHSSRCNQVIAVCEGFFPNEKSQKSVGVFQDLVHFFPSHLQPKTFSVNSFLYYHGILNKLQLCQYYISGFSLIRFC